MSGARRDRAGSQICLLVSAVFGALCCAPLMPAAAQTPIAPVSDTIDNSFGIPDLSELAPPADDPKGVSNSLKILVLLTVLSIAPSILIMMTSFTRILVVLALMRQAIGTQQLPPAQVLSSLSLILTMIVMAPTWQQMKAQGVDPYLDGKMSQEQAWVATSTPLKHFMIRQIEAAGNEDYAYMFREYAEGPLPENEVLDLEALGLGEVIPAFVLSELKTAFVMGFKIYLPFLVIDMVIASILISMGMMMLPPVLISLPFKLMLFVLADGWGMVVGSLLRSFN